MEQKVGNIHNSFLHAVNVNKGNIYNKENNDKKTYNNRGIYFILVITNVISILAILIHFVDVNTISNNSFIGIVASLMAICATFIVGFQIYNSIEYRSEIQKLQKIQENYEKNLKEIESRLIYESNEAYIGIYIVQGITFKDKFLTSSLKSFLKSIIHSLNVGDIKRTNVAIRHIKTLTENKNDFNNALQTDEIKDIIDEIRKHKNYEYIEDWLDELFFNS